MSRSLRLSWGAAWRIALLAAVTLAVAALLFGRQLAGYLAPSDPVAIGVHNGTRDIVVVSAVSPGGGRAFYAIGPADTRLIPDDPNEVISILDATCHVVDAHGRGHQPPAFIVAEVSESGVTWREQAPLAALAPADKGQPCAIR